jgi:hypothetical protein
LKHSVSDARSQPVLGDNVNATAEQRLQVFQKSSEVKETAAGLQVNQHIDVAIAGGIASRNGTKNANVRRSMTRCQKQDFLAIRPQQFREISVHPALPFPASNYCRRQNR